MSHSPRVFVSASGDHHLDENQLEVKQAILRELEDRRFELWRYFEKGPLRKGWGFEKANEAMAEVHGTIVLAFAQWECNGLCLGHIAFSKGDIASSFDEVRVVLQREGFLD